MIQLKTTSPPPPGLTYFPNLSPPHKTFKFHQFLVLILTFSAYSAFHASRKPPSIVKSILTVNSTKDESGWAPFNVPDGPHMLGELDLAFLLSYAFGMYFAGHVGDSYDLRVFLVIGMMGSGVFVVLFGLCYFLDLHKFGSYVVIQVFCGLFQSVGWPCVVAVVGNWFGKAKRGLIMGVWNSHTSVRNIVGSVVASSVLGFGWGWSFVLPGVFIMVVAVFVYLFLVVSPENIGFELAGNEVEMVNVESMALVDSGKSEVLGCDDEGELGAIGFAEAWKLPHVASYAFCLFFSKLVAYTFLYWLPFYIRHTSIYLAFRMISNK